MDKNLQNIEDLFRKALKEDEEIPSLKVWDDIDKKLDKDKVISIRKKYSHLKKVVFLLIFFLCGLSVYIWNNRDNNLVKRSNDDLAREAKTKNKSLPTKPNTAPLQNRIDSLNTNVENSVAKTDYIIIDKNIEKQPNKKWEKRIKPAMTDNASNSSITSNKIKSVNTTKSLTSHLPNSPISKQGKLFQNDSNYKAKIKTPAQIEDERQLVVKRSDIEASPILLTLKQLNPAPVTAIKSSSTNLIDTRKMLNSIALAQTITAINNDKSITQKAVTKSKKQSRFSITAFYSPDVAFYHFENSDPVNSTTSNFEKVETNSFSSTMGALAEYSFNKRWSLQSGVTFSTNTIDKEPGTIYAQPDNAGTIQYKISTSSGDAYILPSFSKNPNSGDSLYSTSTTNILQYVAIPVSIKYKINKGKFTLNAMTGIAGNFLTRGTISTEVEKGNDNEAETTDKIHGLKTFYFSGLTGIGIDYDAYKNFAVCFSPTFRFALNSINKNVPVKSFPNSFGFSLGLKMKL